MYKNNTPTLNTIWLKIWDSRFKIQKEKYENAFKKITIFRKSKYVFTIVLL